MYSTDMARKPGAETLTTKVTTKTGRNTKAGKRSGIMVISITASFAKPAFTGTEYTLSTMDGSMRGTGKWVKRMGLARSNGKMGGNTKETTGTGRSRGLADSHGQMDVSMRVGGSMGKCTALGKLQCQKVTSTKVSGKTEKR
jgi:hypothetical protein